MRLASPSRALIVTNPRCRGRHSDSATPPPPQPSPATRTPEQPAAKAAAILGLTDTNLCARFDRKKMRRSSGAREALRSLRLSVSRGLRRSPTGGRTPPLPSAEVTAFHPDGTHSVRLCRLPDQQFGFNVSRVQEAGERETLSISRMNKHAQKWQLSGMLSVGDEIVAVDNIPCARFTPLQLLSIVGQREVITLRVRPHQSLF